MSLKFSDRIVDHLSHDQYKPSTTAAVARDMRVHADDIEEFEAAVAALEADGRIDIGERDGLLRLPGMPSEITGVFKSNPRGFGFIVPDQTFREGDLFVPAGSTAGALNRDRVRAAVRRESRRGRSGGGTGPGRSEFVGRVVEILERGQEHYVGTLRKRGKQWLVEPDGRSLYEDVIVRDPHVKGAKEGDKVVIELIHFPSERLTAEGVITQVLGEAGRPDVETAAVIAAHGLRTEFPTSAMDEARAAARTFERASNAGWNGREDLREELVFTIDPPDAKDFDDAISIRHDHGRDEWELGVHIADVSHFVPMDGALDREARERGNSVYLPRLVIPMLPEALSNGVCSLQEGVDRLCQSVFITFNGKGEPVRHRLAATVIRSAKRMTYLEAQALIDGDEAVARTHARTETPPTPELLKALRLSEKLAKTLEARRHRDGMIVLNLPEVDLVFDDEGHVVDAVPEDDAYTHKLIEMFMVEANEALARTFEDLGVPILRRIHPEPSHGDLTELRLFAAAVKMRVPDYPTRKDLQQLLQATRNTPAGRAIHFAVLRTFSKATYSPAMVGHYALASDHYAHFTSPIRRYPDLTLHRTMAAYLELTNNGRNAPTGKNRRALGRKLLGQPSVLDEGTLVAVGRKCSETEVEAEEAERELRSYLVMKFLAEKHLGSEFDGVITGLVNRGVFVSLDRFLIEGMVKVEDLPGSDGARADRWILQQHLGRMTAARSGAVLAIGDVVKAQVVSVELTSRHLYLALTKLPERRRASSEEPAAHGRQRPQGGGKASHEFTRGGKREMRRKGTMKSSKRKRGR